MAAAPSPDPTTTRPTPKQQRALDAVVACQDAIDSALRTAWAVLSEDRSNSPTVEEFAARFGLPPGRIAYAVGLTAVSVTEPMVRFNTLGLVKLGEDD